MKTVERIIGYKPGTGGSSGVAFLKKVVVLTFFPELLDVRSEIGALMAETVITPERGRCNGRSTATRPQPDGDHSSCIGGAQPQSARTRPDAFERKE